MGVRSPLGLALGGGGARGGAHIGVLKVLDRAGIAVGPIAGTSAGGLVGGLYAAGLSGAEIEALLLGLRPAALVRLDRSGWSLLDAQRFFDLMRRRVGDARIEDLPRPFAAVAVDLLSRREVLLMEGPLVQAIQATIAVPGILSPVAHGGALLVDGGLANNLPVDVARKLGAACVVGVHLGTALAEPEPDLAREQPLVASLPGLPRLLSRMLSLLGRRQAMLAITRSIGILTAALCDRRLQECPPDLLLRPKLDMQMMDLHRLPEAIAAGERVAEAHLDEIQRLADSVPVAQSGCRRGTKGHPL